MTVTAKTLWPNNSIRFDSMAGTLLVLSAAFDLLRKEKLLSTIILASGSKFRTT
jgi:hypothetical protein